MLPREGEGEGANYLAVLSLIAYFKSMLLEGVQGGEHLLRTAQPGLLAP